MILQVPRLCRPQSLEEEALLEQTQQHLTDYSNVGLRVLMAAVRTLSEEEYQVVILFSKHRPYGPMLSISLNVRLSVRLSVRLFVRVFIFVVPFSTSFCPHFPKSDVQYFWRFGILGEK